MEQPKPEQSAGRRPSEVPMYQIAKASGYTGSFVTGVSIANGIMPDLVAASGYLWGVTYAVIICWGITFMVGSFWHAIMKLATEVRTVFLAMLLVLGGVAAFAVGMGTSGRFLTAKVDGPSAVRAHENEHLDFMDGILGDSRRLVEADQQLIPELSGSRQGLVGSQDNEGNNGTVSKKKSGKGVVYRTIGQGVSVFDDKLAVLKADDAKRADLLHQAEYELIQARGLTGVHQEDAFASKVSEAAQKLRQANSITLLNGVAGLGLSLPVGAAREPFDRAMQGISRFIDSAREKRFQIVVPNYEPMPAKDAVMANPPIAGWIMAGTIEVSPLLMILALLLQRVIGDRKHSPLVPAE